MVMTSFIIKPFLLMGFAEEFDSDAEDENEDAGSPVEEEFDEFDDDGDE